MQLFGFHFYIADKLNTPQIQCILPLHTMNDWHIAFDIVSSTRGLRSFCCCCFASVQDKLMAWNCFLLFFLFTISVFAILHTILSSWMTSDGIFPLCKKKLRLSFRVSESCNVVFYSRKYITGNNVMQMMSRYICMCIELSCVELKSNTNYLPH